MGNTIKTLAAGDITREALAILHNNLIFTKRINKQYDDRFAVSGAKNGGTLLIREPNQFTVRSGAVIDTQDVTESTQTLTLATQRGVDVNFSSVELTLSMDDFSTRILKPAMSRLAAEVDSINIGIAYKGIYNHILGTKGSASTLADVQSSRAKLSKGLTPLGDRSMILESLSMNQVVSDSKALFNPSSEISRQYNMGIVGTSSSFSFFETEMIPVHTMGTFADTDTPIVNTSTGITSGTATIAITSGTSAGTVTEGSVFTVADVFAVNPETKDVYPHLQQWVVTADATASTGAVTVAVSPTPITSGAKQNVSLVSAGASKAVLFETVGGSGTISTGYLQGLAFHKDFMTFVTADLEMPMGAHFAAREVFDGISMRIWRDGDIVNDKFPTRIDVLFGQKVLRPEWACRLSGDD
jgi:hypothetical protein